MRQAIDFSKDLINGIWDKAGRQKDQLVTALSREFVKFLQQINIAEELQKVLDGMTLDIHAKIDFSKKNSNLKIHAGKPKSKKKRS